MDSDLTISSDQYVQGKLQQYEENTKYAETIIQLNNIGKHSFNDLKLSNPTLYYFVSILLIIFCIFVLSAIVKLKGMLFVKVLLGISLFAIILFVSLNNRLIV